MKRFNWLKGAFFGLLAFALVAGSFGAVKAEAADTSIPNITWKYDTATDSILLENSTPAAVTVKFAQVKESNAELKGSKFTGSVSVNASGASIGLTKKATNGVKVDNAKDVYLVLAAAPAKKSTSYTADIHIAPTTAKKLTVNINYGISGKAGANAVSSFVVKPAQGEAKTVEPKDTEDYKKLQYSLDDGKTWASVTDSDAPFDGAKLAANLGKKIQFRLEGDATTAVRNSKAVKVSLKKEAKAMKKINLDAKTNTVAIKNGFDYAVVAGTATAGAVTLDNLTTILPYNKNGTATSATAQAASYAAVKFKDETASSFTATKIKKGLTLDQLLGGAALDKDVLDKDMKLTVIVRKSAGVGKPAQALFAKTFDIASKPAINATKESKVDKEKKHLEVVVNNDKVAKAKLGNGGFSGCEFAIVNVSDLSKIDWETVKWTDKALTMKTKTSYSTTTGDKVKAEIDPTSLSSIEILVRTKGTKNSKFASEYIETVLEAIESTGEDAVKEIVWNQK